MSNDMQDLENAMLNLELENAIRNLEEELLEEDDAEQRTINVQALNNWAVVNAVEKSFRTERFVIAPVEHVKAVMGYANNHHWKTLQLNDGAEYQDMPDGMAKELLYATMDYLGFDPFTLDENPFRSGTVAGKIFEGDSMETITDPQVTGIGGLNKIHAIKVVRSVLQIGLKEAKTFVENAEEKGVEVSGEIARKLQDKGFEINGVSRREW